jgi:hypothetical protein
MGTPDRQYGRELATEPEVDSKIAIHASATLLHEIDQSGTIDVVRDANGRMQLVRVRTGVLGPVIRETELTRNSVARVATVVDRQFEPPGTLAHTRTFAVARDVSGRFSGGTLTVT